MYITCKWLCTLLLWINALVCLWVYGKREKSNSYKLFLRKMRVLVNFTSLHNGGCEQSTWWRCKLYRATASSIETLNVSTAVFICVYGTHSVSIDRISSMTYIHWLCVWPPFMPYKWRDLRLRFISCHTSIYKDAITFDYEHSKNFHSTVLKMQIIYAFNHIVSH